MIPMAAMVVMTAALPRRGRTLLLATIVVIALASLVVGAGQLSGEYGNALRFYTENSNFLVGFQSYHKSEAEVLLVAIVATATVARDLADEERWRSHLRVLIGMALVVTVMLTLGVLLSASRTGIALLAIALPAQLVIIRPVIHFTRRQALIGAAFCAAMLVVGVVMLWGNPMFARAQERFHQVTQLRPEIWRDSLYAARTYYPWGAGMGSFVPVYAAVERLNLVDVYYTNRAHNDYLELLIEGGAFAVAWGVAILAILMRGALKGFGRQDAMPRGQVICAVAALCQLGLHSVLDCPLRSMALAAIASAAAGLLFMSPDLEPAGQKALPEPGPLEPGPLQPAGTGG